MGIETLPRRTNQEVIGELLKLKDAVAYDIGCGEGRVTRMLSRGGAKVVGIDPGPQQIKRALAEPNAAGERYVLGAAENLDIASGTADVVVFFNSLHHVPVELLDKALSEAARVLRAGGALYIAEPVADGPQFQLQRPYNDETGLRALAYEAIKRATAQGAAQGLSEECETIYLTESKHANFEAYRENSVSIRPERAKLFDEKDAELRESFARLGEKRADGWYFAQPIRVNLLRKR